MPLSRRSRRSHLARCLVFLILWGLPGPLVEACPAQEAAPSYPGQSQPTVVSALGPQLVRVVALVRHGVRAPTQSAETLALWSQQPWPDWPVRRAHLTARGAHLVEAMWVALRRGWSAHGLWPVNGPPAPGSIFVRADSDQRTRGTARAILRGLGYTQGYAVSDAPRDPLFHPAKVGLHVFTEAERSSVAARLARLRQELAGPLQTLASISGPPAPELCVQYGRAPGCSLAELPDRLRITDDGHSLELTGGLGIASGMAEIFLLEFVQWPGQDVGWGKVDRRLLQTVLPLHGRVFNALNRAAPVALARGAALLAEMGSALLAEHYDARCNAAALTVFVGHDTNLATVGGLLGFDWQLPGWPSDSIPPGSALLLELWQMPEGREVRLRFASLPLEVLHRPLSEATARLGLAPLVGAGPRYTEQDFAALYRRVTAGGPRAPQDILPLRPQPAPR